MKELAHFVGEPLLILTLAYIIIGQVNDIIAALRKDKKEEDKCCSE